MNYTFEEQNMSETKTGKDTVQCEHEWKAQELTQNKSHVKLICMKCGATKEIELFP
jgi:Fe2+ or Zn2+ uptake regulation protein